MRCNSRTFRSSIALSLTLLALGASGCQNIKDSNASREVRKRVYGIGASNSIEYKAKSAEELYVISLVASDSLSDDDIKSISTLVSSNTPVVSYWASRSLGEIGIRSKPYIPLLYQNLKKVECIAGPVTSASGIRLALEQLGEKPRESKCARIINPNEMP